VWLWEFSCACGLGNSQYPRATFEGFKRVNVGGVVNVGKTLFVSVTFKLRFLGKLEGATAISLGKNPLPGSETVNVTVKGGPTLTI
jgi:hypothetical protein